MSFSLRVTNQYKKDFKKKQYNLSYEHKRKLKTAIIKLSEKLDLPKEYKDHALTGKLHNYRECHIAPDLLLIYRVIRKINELQLVRLGSHSELFK